MKTSRKVLGAGAAVAALSLTQIPTVNAAAGVSFTNSQVDRVHVTGSDTTFGLMNALGSRDPKLITQLAEAWRPWRAYAVMKLWHHLEHPT